MEKFSGWFAIVGRIVIVALLMFTSFARADDAETVRLVVEKNVNEIVATFEAKKLSFDTDPGGFYRSMEEALSQIVDFRRIAGRVMGKYGRGASKEQRDQFVSVFKSSLFDAYAKALVETGDFKIVVIKAQINPRSEDRATVDMEVTSQSGSVYPISYSMYKDKDGTWLMENVIVFGVNLGLAFREKFEAQMRETKGSIDKVIAGWVADVEIDQPEEG